MSEFLHNGEWVEVPEGAVRLIRLAALTEARDAVAALEPVLDERSEWTWDALAAIDALREGK